MTMVKDAAPTLAARLQGTLEYYVECTDFWDGRHTCPCSRRGFDTPGELDEWCTRKLHAAAGRGARVSSSGSLTGALRHYWVEADPSWPAGLNQRCYAVFHVHHTPDRELQGTVLQLTREAHFKGLALPAGARVYCSKILREAGEVQHIECLARLAGEVRRVRLRPSKLELADAGPLDFVPCGRCGGTGFVYAYWVQDGVCFQCGGTGR